MIREAKTDDLEFAVEGLLTLHREAEAFGGMVRQGPRTEHWVRTSVEAALNGFGLALIAEVDGPRMGVSLMVDCIWPYDGLHDRSVLGLGTWVVPEFRRQGVANALYTVAKTILTERGYDAYYGGFLHRNGRVQRLLPRKGFVGYETSVVMDLKEN